MTISDFIDMLQEEKYPMDMKLVSFEDDEFRELQHVTPDFEANTLEMGWFED